MSNGLAAIWSASVRSCQLYMRPAYTLWGRHNSCLLALHRLDTRYPHGCSRTLRIMIRLVRRDEWHYNAVGSFAARTVPDESVRARS